MFFMSVSKNLEVAFLVVSCDKYADLWEPFFMLLDKYWPDRPFNVYLVANELQFKWPGVKVINVGADVSYADNLLKASESVKEDWMLIWLEDLFFSAPVDTDRLISLINRFKKFNSGYLKFAPDMPLAFQPEYKSEIGPLPKGIRYRSAIGGTLYHRTTLDKLLLPGSSAWDLDKSRVSDDLDDPFYALSPKSAENPPISYENVLIKGKWSRVSLGFLRTEGFQKLIRTRELESIFSLLYAKLYIFRLSIFRILRLHWK